MSESAPAAERLRLLIVDDQPLIRRALAMTLGVESDIEVVGQAVDGIDAIEQALALVPDVIVMDLQMPRASGVVATREITAKLPSVGVVVLTTFDQDDLVFEAIRAGARAYLLKDAVEEEVLDTIRAVHRGESRLSPSIARKVMEQFRRFGALPAQVRAEEVPTPSPASAPPAAPVRASASSLEEPLTDKEERILQLISEGKSNKQIGATVFLAEGTVKNYVTNVLGKIDARDRTQAALRARELGLI